MDADIIRIAKRDGTFVDVEAHRADLIGNVLVLRDRRGNAVARFQAREVLAHGPPESLPLDPDEQGTRGA